MKTRKASPPHPDQIPIPFIWEKKVRDLTKSISSLQESLHSPVFTRVDTDAEACMAVAMWAKKIIAESGMTVEEFVHQINLFFGRTETGAKGDDPECFRPLTVPMMRNYLSRPVADKLPAYMIFAFHAVGKSLLLAQMFAESEGGAVVTATERRRMILMQLQDRMAEAKVLEEELKQAMRRIR